MQIRWDGITQARTVCSEEAHTRQELADAAKAYDWPRVLELISDDPALVNTTRPDGVSFYAPLHQAAHGGAPVSVVEELLGFGAFRTLTEARGTCPFDIATRLGSGHLLDVLTPHRKHHVPAAALDAIQRHFHAVIERRAGQLTRAHRLRLPQIQVLLEFDAPRMSFRVPGMYGGFDSWFERTGDDPLLMSESWSRVGSGERHEIGPTGSRLVATGLE